MSIKPRFIFVGGAGRSGTTLVQKILLSHPKIEGGPEFYYSREILNLWNKMKENAERSNMDVFYTRRSLDKSFKEFYLSFFQSFMKAGSCFISEKTPSNIEVAEQLLKFMPDSVFIHVYRDGRAVLNSHLKVKSRARKKGKNLTEIGVFATSHYWNQSVANLETLRSDYKDRFFEIQYEQLIVDPLNAFDPLISALNIEIHPELENPSLLSKASTDGKVHINEIWYTQAMYEKDIDTHRLEAWKREMNLFQRFLANSLMYNELKKLKYPTSSFYRPFASFLEFILNWKDRLREVWILRPFLLFKRKLQ